MFKCIMCERIFNEFNSKEIILHFMNVHNGVLIFLTNDELKEMLEEV